MSRKSVIAMIIIAIIMFLLGSVIGYEAGEKTVKTETVIIYRGNLSQAQSVIIAGLRQPIVAGTWRITVISVNESVYVRVRARDYSWEYYEAPPGMKAVVVRIKFENIGDYTLSLEEFRYWKAFEPLIITNSNRSYEMKTDYSIKLSRIPSRSFAEKIDPLSVELKELHLSEGVKPGEFIEGDLLFLIPQLEKPIEMIISYSPRIEWGFMTEHYLRLIIVIKLEQS